MLSAKSSYMAKVSSARTIRMPCVCSGSGSQKRFTQIPEAAAMKPYFKAESISVELTKSKSLITAIKTPYLSDGRFDLKVYDKMLEDQIEAGVEGVVVGGTTGEGHLMSWDEQIMLTAHTVNNYGTHLHVIGNTGSNSTREAVHATQQGFAVGMHAALQINPYYGKTSHTGLIHHFNAVMEEGPAIIYNVPGRTGQDIPLHVIEKVAKHPNFAGVKECTGNDRIKLYTDQGITCWSGNDDEAHDAVHHFGAKGVISVTSNIIPGVFRKLMDERDDEMAAKCLPLMTLLFAEPNPIGINTIHMMGGMCNPVWRLPYVPMSLDQRKQFVEIIKELGIEHTVYGKMEVMADEDFIYLSSF